MRSARTPPGFVTAIWAPWSRIAASCASAITSPRAVSPAGDGVRVRSAVIRPIGLFATSATRSFQVSTNRLISGSGGTSRVTTRLSPFSEERTTSPVRRSTRKSTWVITRPNDEPEEYSRGLPRGSAIWHTYCWWVCPARTTSISGSASRAMRVPAPATTSQESGRCPDGTSSPSWTSSTMARTPRRLSSAAARSAAATSSSNRSPWTPDGVTIAGVVLVTTPMNPTFTPLILRIVHGLIAGLFVFSDSTLAPR